MAVGESRHAPMSVTTGVLGGSVNAGEDLGESVNAGEDLGESVNADNELGNRELENEAQSVDDHDREREPVTLREWETRRLELTKRQAGRLQETTWLSVTPDPEDGYWNVKAKQWVGGFTIDGLRVIVRPKINPKNLFLLLEVGLPPDAWLPEAIDYAETHDLLPALISFFARTAETTLARGHYHSYRHEEEDLLALRGRLDFQRQFRRGGLLVPMACSYDDFTADVAENRYLKAAMQRAIRVAGVLPLDRGRLMRLLVALEDVTDALVDVDDIERITFTRLNDHYLPAMRLARLILAHLTLQDHHGDTTASAFMPLRHTAVDHGPGRPPRNVRANSTPHPCDWCPDSRVQFSKRLVGFGTGGFVGSGGNTDPQEAFDARESLSDLSDGFSESVVVLTQLAVRGLELFAEVAVRGLEVFAEFVGAALLVPDDSQGDHQQGDELSDGVCLHAP